MDHLTFFSKLIETLAWPVSIMILAGIFRTSILELISRITAAEFGGTKWQLETLQKASQEADEADLPPAPPRSAQTKESSPNSRIIDSWTELETFIKNLHIRFKGIPPRIYTDLIVFFKELVAERKTPPETLTLFRSLRELRNQVVDPKGYRFAATDASADSFEGLVARIMAQLNSIPPSSD